MKYLVVLLLAFCFACGDSYFLESGTYDVTLTYTHDDWCMRDDGCIGDTSEVEWKIKGHEDKYELSVVGGSDTKFKGVHKAGSETIDFHYVQDMGPQLGDCVQANVIDIVLKPGKKAQGFTGTASQMLRLCWMGNTIENTCEACGSLLTEADAVGKLQE